jgi:large subunit ribosomal protein L22
MVVSQKLRRPRPKMSTAQFTPVSVARARHIRGSTRRLRDVAYLVRGQSVSRAIPILASTNKKAAKVLSKVIHAAMANAIQQHPHVTQQSLQIGRIMIDEGPMWKRFRAAAMGRATTIRKRTSHITVELATQSVGV